VTDSRILNQPTGSRILHQLIGLTDNPDTLSLDEADGQQFLQIGNHLTIALSLSSQAALDKLATLTAQAAADQRARTLKAVS
jgi:hypothetical protein